MDFEQSALKSQCEEDCSLIHEQFDDVVPIQMDLENGILGLQFLLLIFVTYRSRVNIRKHGWVLHIMFYLC
jgi:hypothetical protein